MTRRACCGIPSNLPNSLFGQCMSPRGFKSVVLFWGKTLHEDPFKRRDQSRGILKFRKPETYFRLSLD